MGATVTALECFLFEFMERFKKRYPSVHFQIHTGSSSKMIADLKRGKLDVVFNTTPFVGADNLRINEIRSFKDVLIGGRKYEVLKNKPLSVRELQKYPFIMLAEGMSFRTHVDEIFARHGVKIVPEMEADSSALIVPIVSQNLGLSLVPEKMADAFFESGHIVKLNLTDELPERHVTVVTEKSKPETGAVRQMLDMIKEISLSAT